MEQIAKRNQAFKDNNSIEISATNAPVGNGNNVMVPYNTENVIDYIQYIKQQKQGKKP